MREESKAFSRRYGGICADEWAEALAVKWQNTILRWKTHRNMAWKKPLPEIDCCILANSTINAAATRSGDGYLIAIFDGLRHTLHSLFSSLLADPRAFPSIGSAYAESLAPISPRQTLGDLTAKLSTSIYRTPKDHVRKHFALHMTELALQFAFEHELAHIVLGHIDHKYGAMPLLEIRPSDKSDLKASRALEMHADEIAFSNCFFWVLDSMTGEEVIDPMRAYILTMDAQFLDFFAATYCLFELFDSDRALTTHPSPIHRQVRLAVIFSWMSDELKLPLQHKATDIAGGVMGNVDLYMEEIFNVDWQSRRDESKEILLHRMKEVIESYTFNVQALYESLEAHSFVELES